MQYFADTAEEYSMTKIDDNEIVTIFSDGGSRGNPGHAAIGNVLINEKGEVVAEVSKYIGIATNNAAEYLAVIYGLHEALYLEAKRIVVNVDSQLVARQLTGSYKVNDPRIKKFRDIILNLFRLFDTVNIKEIPREKNKAADALVNRALNVLF